MEPAQECLMLAPAQRREGRRYVQTTTSNRTRLPFNHSNRSTILYNGERHTVERLEARPVGRGRRVNAQSRNGRQRPWGIGGSARHAGIAAARRWGAGNNTAGDMKARSGRRAVRRGEGMPGGRRFTTPASGNAPPSRLHGSVKPAARGAARAARATPCRQRQRAKVNARRNARTQQKRTG